MLLFLNFPACLNELVSPTYFNKMFLRIVCTKLLVISNSSLSKSEASAGFEKSKHLMTFPLNVNP